MNVSRMRWRSSLLGVLLLILGGLTVADDMGRVPSAAQIRRGSLTDALATVREAGFEPVPFPASPPPAPDMAGKPYSSHPLFSTPLAKGERVLVLHYTDETPASSKVLSEARGMDVKEAVNFLRSHRLEVRSERGVSAPTPEMVNKAYEYQVERANFPNLAADAENFFRPGTRVFLFYYGGHIKSDSTVADDMGRVPSAAQIRRGSLTDALATVREAGFEPVPFPASPPPAPDMAGKPYSSHPLFSTPLAKGERVLVLHHTDETPASSKVLSEARGMDVKEAVNFLRRHRLEVRAERGVSAPTPEMLNKAYEYQIERVNLPNLAADAENFFRPGTRVFLFYYGDGKADRKAKPPVARWSDFLGDYRCSCGAIWFFLRLRDDALCCFETSDGSYRGRPWRRNFSDIRVDGRTVSFNWTSDRPTATGGASGTGKVTFDETFSSGKWTMTGSGGNHSGGTLVRRELEAKK